MISRRRFVIAALVLAGGLLLLWTMRHRVWSGPLEILEAEYGVPGRTCTAGPEIKQRATEACVGFRARCLLSVGHGWCGDPAPGVLKTLTVEYRCGTTRKRASAADNTGLVLSCP